MPLQGSAMPTPTHVFRARWLIPAEGPAIEDGALVVAGGRIARVGRWARLKAHVAGERVEEFADAAILPGFVNAHTHLSLSDMGGKFRPTKNFAGWIARLTARRMVRTGGGIRRAVRKGAKESLAAGTVAGADLTPDVDRCDVLASGPVRWTVFGEVFRFGQAGLDHLKSAVRKLESLRRTAGLRVGLSPHAPWTVGAEVFMAARREADRRGWPLSTHLHETLDEIAFTERGEGVLFTWMRRVGILPRTWRPPGLRPIPMLAEAGFFRGPVLVAHGNYLTDEEIAILARSRSSVAYCPRSHAFFKHEGHPWRRLLAGGANVCLGTDSLASSPGLSVLQEARFLMKRQADSDPRTLLQMATVRGARALGLEGEFGDLRKGLAAAWVVVGPLPETNDPLAAVLAGEGTVRRVGLPPADRPVARS